MKATYSWRAKGLKAPKRSPLLRLIERAAQLAGLPSEGDWCANVIFLNDPAMAAANAGLVGHEGTTDVITFSYFDDPDSCFAGDLMVELLISADVARREGGKRPEFGYGRELALYIVHGMLHCVGEDDLSPGPRRRMRRRERAVLAGLDREFDYCAIFGE